ILLVLAAAVHGRAALPPRTDLPRLASAAFLGVALNQGLYLEGLARSTPINAVLVMCLIPVFTFGLATVAGLETFSGTRLAGALGGGRGHTHPADAVRRAGALRGELVGVASAGGETTCRRVRSNDNVSI